MEDTVLSGQPNEAEVYPDLPKPIITEGFSAADPMQIDLWLYGYGENPGAYGRHPLLREAIDDFHSALASKPIGTEPKSYLDKIKTSLLEAMASKITDADADIITNHIADRAMAIRSRVNLEKAGTIAKE